MSRNPGRIRPLEKLERLKTFLKDYQLEEHHAGDPGYVWLADSAVCITVVNPNPNPDPEHLATNNLNLTLAKTGMVLAFAEAQTPFHNARDHFDLLEELSVGIIEDRFCCAVLSKDGKTVTRRIVLSEKASADPAGVFKADPNAVAALDAGPCTASFTHWDRKEVYQVGNQAASEA